jgi:hypothetical protein
MTKDKAYSFYVKYGDGLVKKGNIEYGPLSETWMTWLDEFLNENGDELVSLKIRKLTDGGKC